MQIIPVCFTFDKNFVVPAAVALYSLLEYADRRYYYRLFVLHVDLLDKEQMKLRKAIARFDSFSSLEFLDVKNYHDDQSWLALKSKQHYSKEIYNKLILDQLFPQYDRILCSDVDVIFRGDISSSYFLFPKETFYVAGVRSMVKSDICNWYSSEFSLREQEIIEQGIGAGYFLLNLSKIREDGVGRKMCASYKENVSRLIQPEQDVINLCCYPYINYMPYEFMVCTYYYSGKIDRRSLVEDVNLEAVLDAPVQIHYAGFDKPWNSIFCKKSIFWFRTLYDANFVYEYIKVVPFYMIQRIRKYSIRRFLSKIKAYVKKS